MKNLNIKSIIYLERYDGSYKESTILELFKNHVFGIYRNSFDINAYYGYCEKNEKSFILHLSNNDDILKRAIDLLFLKKNGYATNEIDAKLVKKKFHYEYEYLLMDANGNLLQPKMLLAIFKKSKYYLDAIKKYNYISTGKKTTRRKIKDRGNIRSQLIGNLNAKDEGITPRLKRNFEIKCMDRYW